MIQATPFDLVLFGADIDPLAADSAKQLELAVNRFRWCCDCFYNTNQRLRSNSALGDFQQKVPMTEWLFEQLCEIPPWPKNQQGGPAYTLKTSILAFINARAERIKENPRINLQNDSEWAYRVSQPDNLFRDLIHQNLQDAWTESIGICAFQRCSDITNSCMISPGRAHKTNSLTIEATDIHQSQIQPRITDVPMMIHPVDWPKLGEPNIWAWECFLRWVLWKDVRLPFSGPFGPFGFRPHSDNNWRPGQHLTMRRVGRIHGYLDEFGGLWKWNGGRAITEAPFDGHWDIQLCTNAIRLRWAGYLETNLNQTIKLRSTHINIEADGRITDTTYDVI
jgi:hypothetical protein